MSIGSQLLLSIMIGFIAILSFYAGTKQSRVELPEEYKLITPKTPIKGHFEGQILVIEFDHGKIR